MIAAQKPYEIRISLYSYARPPLPGRINFLLNRKLQPEVACQDISLDKLDFNQLGECADQLLEQGLTTTLHAPYSGFNPGSSKKRMRKRAYALAEKSMQLAQKLRARRVVFIPDSPSTAQRRISRAGWN